MNEIDAYKRLYGTMVYCVPHYLHRLGWLHVARTWDGKKMRSFINGEEGPFTLEAWIKMVAPMDVTKKQPEHFSQLEFDFMEDEYGDN